MDAEHLHPPTSIAPGVHCPGCGASIYGLTVGEVCPHCGRHLQGLCRGCGYDLAGLPLDGVCPECAKPVLESLRGDLLVFADAAYVRSLHRGVIVVLASILFMVGTVIAGFILAAVIAQGGAIPFLSDLVSYGAIAIGVTSSGLSVYGWYLFSAPDPGVSLTDRGDRPRRVLRIAVIATAVMTLLGYAIELVGMATGAGLGAGPGGAFGLMSAALTVAGLLVWAVQFFAAMKYLQWLGPRIPDFKLVTTAKRFMWLLPVLYIPGALACGLGPLIALVLYYNLLNDFRKALKRIIARQAATPA